MKKYGLITILLITVLVVIVFPKMSSGEAERDYFRSAAFDKPMRSVELQYYRIPRDRWEMMAGRMAQYNADTISTYIHWGFHEYEEGKFDFTGETLPERDLVSFIEICRDHGLLFVIKPGPFIDAETLAGGIPQWLFEKYPETIAVRNNGKPMIHGDSGMPRISYLHPTYLKLVRRYYKKLGDAVAHLQWPEGPIVAVQVDNETPGDGFTSVSNYLGHNFKADYNSYYVEEAWPRWLKDRYGSIEELNRAYGASYPSFNSVPMPKEWDGPENEKDLQVYIDLNRFAEWQYVEGLRVYTKYLQEAGFYAPTYQDLLCMPWDVAGLLGDIGGMTEAVNGWMGVNVYSEVYRLWTIFVGNIAYKYNWDEYIHNAIWRVRLSGTLSEPYPAFVPEITCSERWYFQAPVVWGADAMNIYVGWQTAEDNLLTSPPGSWGMEACVTAEGEVRDCMWNGKNTYMFMESSGGFGEGLERPRLAIGYTHEPEHAWNWEFRFNLDLPHKKVKHKKLKHLVEGTNTGDRGQLIARELVLRDVEFDVIHMDHLRPGQLEAYDQVIYPVAWMAPRPDADNVIFLEPGGDDMAALDMIDLDKYRTAWHDSDKVDVTERSYGEGAPTIVSIANRGRRPVEGTVYFDSGKGELYANMGGKTIGFVSVLDNGLKAAVIEDEKGKAEFRLGDDKMAFTGEFAALAVGPGVVMATAVDSGEVTIKSKHMSAPAKLYRLYIDGRVEEQDYSYNGGTLVFNYDAGEGPSRTDMYVALAQGLTFEEAMMGYLKMSGMDK